MSACVGEKDNTAGSVQDIILGTKDILTVVKRTSIPSYVIDENEENMLNSVAVIAKAKAVANKWIMDEDKKLTLKLLQTIHTVKSLDNVEYCLYIFHQALLQEGIKTLFSPFHVTGTLNLYNSYLLSSTFCEAKSYQCRIPIKSDTITKICSDLKEKAKFASLLKKRLAYRFKVSESEI